MRGAVHVANGTPCQDAVTWWPAGGRGPQIAVAVADGHGSPASHRSDVGARLAVEGMVAALADHAPPLDDPGGIDDFLAEVVARWRDAVLRHVADHPLTATGPGGPTLVYGSTLLALAAGVDGLLLAQLGDGDILLVADDGSTERAFAHDPRRTADETMSLCSPDAAAAFRTRVLPVGRWPAMCVLATDGYANSFDGDAAFLRAGGDFLALVRAHGTAYLGRMLPGWLEETTRLGSGDDVTVAVVDLAG